MANIKFSQFTSTSSSSGVDFLVGYDGTTNVRISPDQLIGSYLLSTSPVKIGASLELGQNAGTPSFSSSFTGTQDLFFGSNSALQKYFKNISIGLGGQLTVNSLPGGGTVLKLQAGVGLASLGQLQLGKYGVGTFPASGSTLIAAFDGGGNLVERDDVVTTASTLAGQIPYFTSPTEIGGTQDFTFTATGSALTTPTIGIGLNGAANTKGAIEINSHINYDGNPFDYFLFNGAGGPFLNFTGAGLFAISVHADGRFMGSGIHIYSDERIKKDISLSDSKEDLETISKIEISNYKHIDEAQGNREHKKVIAQQVAKHYPQAVSIGKDIVPDIYKKSTIEDGIISGGIDNCVAGDKVKLIYPNGHKETVNVIESNGKGIKVDSDKSGDVLIFGKEVDDYHSIDYDALAMLNISATQELHKIIKKLSEEVEQLKSLKNK